MESSMTEKDKKLLEIDICYKQLEWHSSDSILWITLENGKRVPKRLKKECEAHYMNFIKNNKNLKLEEFISNWVKECNEIWDDGRDFYYAILIKERDEYKYQKFITQKILYYVKKHFEPSKRDMFIDYLKYSESLTEALNSQFVLEEEKILSQLPVPHLYKLDEKTLVILIKYYVAVHALVREETDIETIKNTIGYLKNYASEENHKINKKESEKLANDILQEVQSETDLKSYIIEKIKELKDYFGYSSMLVKRIFCNPLWLMPYPTAETYERAKQLMDMLFENIFKDEFLDIDEKVFNMLLEIKNDRTQVVFDMSAPYKIPIERVCKVEELETTGKEFKSKIDLTKEFKLEIKTNIPKLRETQKNEKIEIDTKGLSKDILNKTNKIGSIITDYELVIKYLNTWENQEILNHVKDSLGTINDFMQTAINFVQNIDCYEEKQKIKQYNMITDTMESIDGSLEGLGNLINKLKIKIPSKPEKFYYRFKSVLFNEIEKEKDEIRYKYYLVQDGTDIGKHVLNNMHNPILGTVIYGKMDDFEMNNHHVNYYDENLNIPIHIKTNIEYANNITELKLDILKLLAGVLQVIKKEEELYQYSVLNDRIIGLFEFTGRNAKEFFEQIARNDYGIYFGNDIEVHFARQIIFPAEENNYGNQISTSRKEYFTVSIPKIDRVLNNIKPIEISCDDLEELKNILDSYDIQEEIEDYRFRISDTPEYIRRIWFNQEDDLAKQYSLSPFEYLLIKDDKKLKKENKWLNVDIPDVYFAFIFNPGLFFEIELDYSFEEFIKQLAPHYYGKPEDSSYKTDIGGLDAHITGFGNGIFGIGFNLPDDV